MSNDFAVRAALRVFAMLFIFIAGALYAYEGFGSASMVFIAFALLFNWLSPCRSATRYQPFVLHQDGRYLFACVPVEGVAEALWPWKCLYSGVAHVDHVDMKDNKLRVRIAKESGDGCATCLLFVRDGEVVVANWIG